MDKVVGSRTGDDGEAELDLPDVTRMLLPELISSEADVLTNSLRRVLDELDDREDVIAAFGNRSG